MIEALEAAHERGIVHRDLKPANIKITPEGRVKVLDFGLARADERHRQRPAIANSPTVTVGGTQDGVLLGTAPYMSPEQARGRTVDKRTDIWAFGCVLYEMLTGAPAFARRRRRRGARQRDQDGARLGRASRRTRPPALRLCLRRCLQKDLRQRFHDIADVRLAMEGAFEQPASDSDMQSTQPGRLTCDSPMPAGRSRSLAIAGALAIVVFARSDPCGLPETRLEIVTPPAARSAVARDLARRPQRGLPGRTGSAAALAPVARLAGGAAAGGHRRRAVSILVAGRPVGRRSPRMAC